MELWTAFLLGLVGSLHCAGMCGPLALALPASRGNFSSFLTGRLAYNIGRMVTYCGLGAVFGLLGQTFALAGFQEAASIVSGAAILVGLAASSRYAIGLPAVNGLSRLKSAFASLLRRRGVGSLFLLGLLNGLLPCGLVYAACAGAVASGEFTAGVRYMGLFGLGTIPMMLGLGLAGMKLRSILGLRFQKLVPVCVALVGVLLILRGLSLGIPYLSPDLSRGAAERAVCHERSVLHGLRTR
ncbi:MAG: sulfite exporter TauE/SafE family protein [Verrucomicrobia bacterium]|nr:sulfite exporter TauE/SafE family protein [Verrucomicrobiota bacterium]